MTNHSRKKKLIEPRLQMRFGLLFLTTAGVAVMVQVMVFHFMLNRVASRLPNDGVLLVGETPDVLWKSFVITFLLLAPITLALGIHSTFKIVGPLYRFRVFLGQVIAGERPEACHIRKGDELGDICELLNEATRPVREAPGDGNLLRFPERRDDAVGE